MHRRLRVLSTITMAVLSLTLAACGGGGGGADDDGTVKIAAMFSGPTNDDDYNSLGLAALNQAEADGAEVSYSETVAVPDIEARLNEAVGDGNTVIWTHGGQYYDATAKVALENPDVSFIAEFDGVPENQPENVWVIDRQFHLGFYAMGVFAAKLSKTGVVGYIGGLSLPFSYSEVHAMEQAFDDLGADVTLKPVWTGDFNDATKAQQFTTQLLDQDADVIIGSLSAAAPGTFQAFEGRPEGSGWVTAKYTDKSAAAGSHYAGSLIDDFSKPLSDILAKIAAGERSGHYKLSFETGMDVQVSDNVPQEVKDAVDEVMEQLRAGEIEVVQDFSEVK